MDACRLCVHWMILKNLGLGGERKMLGLIENLLGLDSCGCMETIGYLFMQGSLVFVIFGFLPCLH